MDDLNVLYERMRSEGLGLSTQQQQRIDQYLREMRHDTALICRDLTPTSYAPEAVRKCAQIREEGRQKILDVLTLSQRDYVRKETLRRRVRNGGLTWLIKSEDVAPALAELNLTEKQWQEIQEAHIEVLAVTDEQSRELHRKHNQIRMELNQELQQQVAAEFTKPQLDLLERVVGVPFSITFPSIKDLFLQLARQTMGNHAV
ncbi:MAG: hypothetical protein R3C28_31305 [Pirellulaceae bacterium]